VKPGDLIVTSGLGGELPRLLTICQVDRVISTDAQLFKEAIVRPAVDLNRIEVVLVITSKPPPSVEAAPTAAAPIVVTVLPPTEETTTDPVQPAPAEPVSTPAPTPAN
jgi:cell shape-determining protein MreC